LSGAQIVSPALTVTDGSIRQRSSRVQALLAIAGVAVNPRVAGRSCNFRAAECRGRAPTMMSLRMAHAFTVSGVPAAFLERGYRFGNNAYCIG